MTKRITGRRLLPAALAAASVVAMAAPASALETLRDPAGTAERAAPAPSGDQDEQDCARAVAALSIMSMVPRSKSVGLVRLLCAMNQSKKQQDEQQQVRDTPQGQRLFNLPDLPEGLTVRFPGLNRALEVTPEYGH